MSNFLNILEGANPVSPLGLTPSDLVKFVGPEYASINKSLRMTKAQLKYFAEQQQLTSHVERFQDPEQQQQLSGHEKWNKKKTISRHTASSLFFKRIETW